MHTGPRWWDERLARRGAVVGAALGALAAILAALALLGLSPGPALVSYAAGALVGSGLGYLLGGVLGAATHSGGGFSHRAA